MAKKLVVTERVIEGRRDNEVECGGVVIRSSYDGKEIFLSPTQFEELVASVKVVETRWKTPGEIHFEVYERVVHRKYGEPSRKWTDMPATVRERHEAVAEELGIQGKEVEGE